MQNGTTNTTTATDRTNPPPRTAASPAEEKTSLEQALDQVESLKGSLRGAVS